ncbi:MAG: hypothetical protein ACFCVD_09280 [Nodosilinea sp.]
MVASNYPLTGIELVDCAKSCARQGLEMATRQCGYGDDSEKFVASLRAACQAMGIHIDSLDDLITEQQQVQNQGGVEIAPDTPSEL